MDYVVLRVDQEQLGADETRALMAEAAAFDIDVDELSTEMPVDPGVAVIASAALAYLVGRLGSRGQAPGRLWGLLRRPVESRAGEVGVLDHDTRVTFVWDDAARRQGETAAAAMVDAGRAVRAYPAGAVLRWSAPDQRWIASGRPDRAPTIVLLTALDLEYDAVRRHLPDTVNHITPAGTIFEVAPVAGGPWQAALTFVGRGGYGTAALTERAIAEFSPAAILFVGIAGALKADVNLGDVVVGTHVHPYQIGREESGGLLTQPRTWAASPALVQLAHQVSRAGVWRGHLADGRGSRAVFAPIAAGEVVLDAVDSPHALVIRRVYGDAVAVEMESAGLAAAVTLNPKVAALPIRGISDFADGNKRATDRTGSQPRAAAAAAAFAYALTNAIATGVWQAP